MSHQALVLDANILVRAVLGQRVFKLLNPDRGPERPATGG